jgi:RNA polymerase sigma-70 factor (ECF subfamily)
VAEQRSELLRAVHDAHAAELMRYAVRLTGDYAFAQDVVQEALLRACKHPRILEQGDSATRAWLFTVTRNLVIDDWRTARSSREISTDNLPERAQADATDGLLDSWIVSDALSSLSPEHRAAIVGAYYLGQSIAEIARAEQVPEGTVKSRLHYAVRAMRLALQERGVTR